MPEIEVSHLTKDYGSGRGVFDVSLEVERGECFGFLNGAGKTTTIRHLMGFSRPQAGTVAIHGQDCWTRSAELQRTVGYLPGEIALPAGMTGTAFLRMMERMRGVRNDEHLRMLLDTFRLNPDIPTREMSLGVKRKIAVITAFMHDPDILILERAHKRARSRHAAGVHRLRAYGRKDAAKPSSSRRTCSTKLMPRAIASPSSRTGASCRSSSRTSSTSAENRFYQVTFGSDDAYRAFAALPYNEFAARSPERRRARAHVNDARVNQLIADLAEADVTDFEEIPFTLEDYFMQFYRQDRQFEEVR